MVKYICVTNNNECSSVNSSIKEAFEEVCADYDARFHECAFYEVKEVTVELQFKIVPEPVVPKFAIKYFLPKEL